MSRRKFGSFFLKKTGIEAADCKNIIDAEKKVEEANGGKKLPVKLYQSNVVSSRGNIFPLVNTTKSMEKDLEASFF